MDTKKYIRRVMEENNFRLLQSFNSSISILSQRIDDRITEINNSLSNVSSEINTIKQQIQTINNTLQQHENNIEQIINNIDNYIDNLYDYIDNSVIQTVDDLRLYIQEQLESIPSIESFTEEEIRDIIRDELEYYHYLQDQYDSNFITKDNNYIFTKDKKVFITLTQNCIYTKDKKFIVTADNKIFTSK